MARDWVLLCVFGGGVQAQMGAPTRQPSATEDQFLTSGPSLPGPSSQTTLCHPGVASLHAWDLTPRSHTTRLLRTWELPSPTAQEWNRPSGQDVSVVSAEVVGSTVAILIRQGRAALGSKALSRHSQGTLRSPVP